MRMLKNLEDLCPLMILDFNQNENEPQKRHIADSFALSQNWNKIGICLKKLVRRYHS